MENNVCREKEREFKELFYRFQEQGKRLADVYNRLSGITNRIEEESDKPTSNEPVQVSHLNGGLYKDLVTIYLFIRE